MARDIPEWSIAQCHQQYGKLYKRCQEHGLKAEKRNPNWNREVARGKIYQIREVLERAGLSTGKVQKIEEKDPGKVGRILAQSIVEPETRIKDLANQEHMSAKMTSNALKAVKNKYPDTVGAIKAFNHQELIAALKHKTAMFLDSITPEVIEKSTLRERVLGAAIFIDKTRLLEGEPTQILSIQERRSLPDIISELDREAKRRGMTITQEPNPDGTYG